MGRLRFDSKPSGGGDEDHCGEIDRGGTGSTVPAASEVVLTVHGMGITVLPDALAPDSIDVMADAAEIDESGGSSFDRLA